MIHLKTCLLTLSLAGILAAGAPTAIEVGIGTRGYGMGNNHVALARDFSALYYNPAGLGFVPVREFSVSLAGLKRDTRATLSGVEDRADEQRVRVSSAGLLRAFPVQRGGISFAVGFMSPIIFDDVVSYRGEDYYLGSDSLRGGPGTPTIQNTDRLGFGALGVWGGGVGWQIAEGMSVGVSGGLMYGRETRIIGVSGSYDLGGGVTGIEDSETYLSVRYLGYDLRGGLMWEITDRISTGLRVDAPKFIRVSETVTLTDRSTDTKLPEEHYISSLHLPTSGAFGLSMSLPFATVASDITARTPLPTPDAKSSLGHWNIGAGLGAEFPIRVISSGLRVGYSFRQFELSPMASDETIINESSTTTITDRHLLTAGFGTIIRNVAVDLAYGYQFWGFATSSPEYRNTIDETHSLHYLNASFAFRF